MYTLDFDRGSKESDSPKHMQLLHQKFERALGERAVMISSPDCVKSLQLKYIDLLQQVSSADPYLFCQRNTLGGLITPIVEEHASVLREKELVADHLGDILQLWRSKTVALIDEVDLVLHPLKSVVPWSIFACLTFIIFLISLKTFVFPMKMASFSSLHLPLGRSSHHSVSP